MPLATKPLARPAMLGGRADEVGDLLREVPLNPLVRLVLEGWLPESTAFAAPGEQAGLVRRGRDRARPSRS
jgi:hypothetical protein